MASQNADADAEFGTLLASALDRDVDVVTAGGGDALYASLIAGDVDVALLSPMLVVRALDEAGATALAIAVRNGSTTYRSQISVRCDAGIDDLAGLVGSRFGFVSVVFSSRTPPAYRVRRRSDSRTDRALVPERAVASADIDTAVRHAAFDAGARAKQRSVKRQARRSRGGRRLHGAVRRVRRWRWSTQRGRTAALGRFAAASASRQGRRDGTT